MLVMDKKVDAVSLQNKAKLTKLKILFSRNPFSPVTATTTREFQLNSLEELQLKLMFLVPFILQKHASYVCWRYVSCCCKMIIYAVYEPVQGSSTFNIYVTLYTSYN